MDAVESPLWGASLVAIGLLVLMSNMGWLDIDRLAQWWPLLLIAVGGYFLYGSIQKKKDEETPGMSRPAFSPEGVTLGIGLIAIGLLWTLSNLGRVDLLHGPADLVAAAPDPLGRAGARGPVDPPLRLAGELR